MRGAFFLLVLLIGGPLLAWSGYSHRQFRSRLDTEGTTVDATLEGGEERSGRKGSKSYKVNVSYVGGGRPIRKDMPVTGTFFKSITSGESLTVETVRLTHLNSDPEQAIIVGGSPDPSHNLWFGLAMTAAGVIWAGLWARSLASSGPTSE